MSSSDSEDEDYCPSEEESTPVETQQEEINEQKETQSTSADSEGVWSEFLDMVDKPDDTPKIDVTTESVVHKPKPSPVPSLSNFARKRPGGLASALSAISKKAKPSILNKSKEDWDNLKDNQGIRVELDLHSKGGAGYLSKQDFLVRADLRQFEQEKAQRDRLRKK